MAEVERVDPLPALLEEQPSLNWCDEAPLEFDTETFPELKREYHHQGHHNDPGRTSLRHPESTSSAKLGKNSSDVDLLSQHINVSNILGDDDLPSENITMDMTIPSDKVGLIIGRGGKTIKILQEKSGCKMNIIQANASYEDYDKTLRLGPGPTPLVEHARQLVIDLLSKTPGYQFKNKNEHKNEYERSTGRSSGGRYNNNTDTNNNNYNGGGGRFKSVRFPVPKISVGLIIGKGGETIKRIRMETGAKVQFDPINASLGEMDEQAAVISGKPDQIRHACDLIEELVDTAMNGMKKNRDEGHSHRQSQTANNSSNSSNFYNDDNNANSKSNQQRDRFEEERVAVPAGKVKLVIGKGRETIRSIIQQSGAHCDIDRNVPPDSVEKTFILKGTRQQVDLAKDMILDKVNSRPSKRHQRARGNHHGSSDYNEWGQGDPGPGASWTADNYYDPAQTQQQQHDRHFIGSNGSTQDYGYSQWLEYFQPERQQAQADAWEQQVKAEQDNSDPQLLTNDSDSSQTNQDEMTSPKQGQGFSPISPIPSPIPHAVIDSHQNCPEEAQLNDKSLDSEDMDNFRKAQGDQVSLNSTDYEGLSDPTQLSPSSGQNRPPPGLVDPTQGPCPGFQHVHPAHPNCPMEGIPGMGNPCYPAFAYYYGHPVPQAFVHPPPPPIIQAQTVPGPQTIPGIPGPPPLPINGSCTRIVTLFYDINVNSIVVLNQWHFS